MTSAASKESIGELQVNTLLFYANVVEAMFKQERLHATERQAAVGLHPPELVGYTNFPFKEAASESKYEIRNLQEQNGVLKARLDRADHKIEDKAALLQTLQIELSRKEGTFQTLLDAEKLSKNEVLGQVQEANIKVQSFHTELAQKDRHAQELAKRLAVAEAPEREREVVAMKVRIAELEETVKRLADRAMTISCRYENNDLVNRIPFLPLCDDGSYPS